MKRADKILNLLNNPPESSDAKEENHHTVVENLENLPHCSHQPDYTGLPRGYGSNWDPASLEDITNIPDRFSQPVIDTKSDESFSEDDDDSVQDPNYKSSSSSISSSTSSRSNSLSLLPLPSMIADDPNITLDSEIIAEDETLRCSNQNSDVAINENEPVKKGKKRVAKAENWLSNKAKKLRNTGQAYVSRAKSKKLIRARSFKPPCGPECKFRCGSKFDDDTRNNIFQKYWALGDITLQGNFISNHTKFIMPAIRFTGKANPRKHNHAFYFQEIRVCKNFFMATLDINDRLICSD